MKPRTIILLAVLILFFISCQKENTTIQSSSNDESTIQALSSESNELAGAHAVRIGTQVWKIRNLNVGHYRNGDRIPQVTNPAKWDTLTTGAWCWYNNDSANRAVYGKLYNWYAVNDPRGLAPEGWHIPSDSEWTTLSTFLGGDAAAGGKMKQTGTTHWKAPNTAATNSSGFTGIPGGYRSSNGTFYPIGILGYWWGSTEYGSSNAWLRALYYDVGSIGRFYFHKQGGLSVRCVKD